VPTDLDDRPEQEQNQFAAEEDASDSESPQELSEPVESVGSSEVRTEARGQNMETTAVSDLDDQVQGISSSPSEPGKLEDATFGDTSYADESEPELYNSLDLLSTPGAILFDIKPEATEAVAETEAGPEAPAESITVEEAIETPVGVLIDLDDDNLDRDLPGDQLHNQETKADAPDDTAELEVASPDEQDMTQDDDEEIITIRQEEIIDTLNLNQLESDIVVPATPEKEYNSETESPDAEYTEDINMHSPVEDQTATITISLISQLEDDKAILKSFIDRAAARKAKKLAQAAAQDGDYHKRESLQNRRDSDNVRHALASPRVPLEDKDGNVFSPLRAPESVVETGSPTPKPLLFTSEPSTALVLPPLDELVNGEETKSPPRRSGRTRTRFGQLPSATNPAPNRIPVRRTDGNDTLPLNKTEAQELSLLTRRNTRKNKGGAISVRDRLVQWNAESIVHSTYSPTPSPTGNQDDEKGVRWSSTLQFLNEKTGQSEVAPLRDNTPAPTNPDAKAEAVKVREETQARELAGVRTTRSSPKVRRLRAPVINGTPGKGVLGSAVFDDISDDAGFGKKETTSNASNASNATVKGGQPTVMKKLALTPSAASLAALGHGGQENESVTLPMTRTPSQKTRISLLPVPGDSTAIAASARKAARKPNIP
jgi:hypothetical protein